MTGYEVMVMGGTAGSAGVFCRSCHLNFLSSGGEWGDSAESVPVLRADLLVALLEAHVCAPADLAGQQ